MTALPPRDRLAQVASSLVRRAPDQLGELLADDRMADDRAALERLAVRGACDRGAAATTEDEASWLADELLARWAAVGKVTLDPAAGLAGPDAIEVGDDPQKVEFCVVVDGLAPGWTVEWSGDAEPVGDGRRAVADVDPLSEGMDEAMRVGARVFGRSGGRRVVLVAATTAMLVAAHRAEAGGKPA